MIVSKYYVSLLNINNNDYIHTECDTAQVIRFLNSNRYKVLGIHIKEKHDG